MAKAILVDPFACTVTEVEYDGTLARAYELLSHESMPVDLIENARPSLLYTGDAAFVDEEGLLKPCERFTWFLDHHQPLAGKALIVGAERRAAEDDGDRTALDDALTPIEYVRANVKFLEDAGICYVVTNNPWQADAVEATQ